MRYGYDENGKESSPVEYHLFAQGRLCLSQDDLFLPIPSIIPGGIFIKNSSISPKTPQLSGLYI